MDEFVIDAGPQAIGDLTALDIGYAPSRRAAPLTLGGALAGLAAGGHRWGLAGVEVAPVGGGEATYFPFGGWVGSGGPGGSGGGATAGVEGAKLGSSARPGRVVLLPGRREGAPARTTAYRVAVRTAAEGRGGGGGSSGGAGAAGMGGSAGVVLTLFGTGAAAPAEGAARTVSSGPLRLNGRGGRGTSGGGGGPDDGAVLVAATGSGGGAARFQAGGVDAFTFKCRDLGELTSATVSGVAGGVRACVRAYVRACVLAFPQLLLLLTPSRRLTRSPWRAAAPRGGPWSRWR